MTGGSDRGQQLPALASGQMWSLPGGIQCLLARHTLHDASFVLVFLITQMNVS